MDFYGFYHMKNFKKINKTIKFNLIDSWIRKWRYDDGGGGGRINL